MSLTVPFLKMHGAGNDFVVIDHRAGPAIADLPELVRRVCDRRRGVGADGVLLLERDAEHDFAMRYLNADGGTAEYCGNGARCLARVALDLGLGSAGEVRFRTGAGVQSARRTADGSGIDLAFGHVAAPVARRGIEASGRTFEGREVRAGVPHLVIAVDDVESVRLAEWGAALRHHATFAPAGTNVDFIAPLAPSRIAMRTYERGVEGETLACGSGAIASALCALADGAASPVTVMTAGGDALTVSGRAEGGGWDVHLAGPAEVAFSGTWTEAAAVESSSGRR
jgi:diaminopimelate epimerase